MIAKMFRDAIPTIELMRRRGLLHFDLHWENVLTDGEQLYFADLGLAISETFDLAAKEGGFLTHHASTYDFALFARGLLRLIIRLPGGDDTLVQQVCLAHDRLSAALGIGIPEPLAKLLDQYGSLAWSAHTYMRQLKLDSASPYPRLAMEEALASAGPSSN